MCPALRRSAGSRGSSLRITPPEGLLWLSQRRCGTVGLRGCQFLAAPSFWAAGLLPATRPACLQPAGRDARGKMSGRSPSCSSWAEKLHFPPCAQGKGPVQPGGCGSCFKQLHYCCLTAGRRQFLCFPLLDRCQQSSAALSMLILPLLRGELLHPAARSLSRGTAAAARAQNPPGLPPRRLLLKAPPAPVCGGKGAVSSLASLRDAESTPCGSTSTERGTRSV